MEFLSNLAQLLREQVTRKTDTNHPTLFKIKDLNGQDMYFITREKMKEYLKIHDKAGDSFDDKEVADKRNSNSIVEISNSNNFELGKLLEVIMRNF